MLSKKTENMINAEFHTAFDRLNQRMDYLKMDAYSQDLLFEPVYEAFLAIRYYISHDKA